MSVTAGRGGMPRPESETLYREVFSLKGIRKRKRDPFYDLNKVASATECTGLIASLPQSDEEDETYASLYSTHDNQPG